METPGSRTLSILYVNGTHEGGSLMSTVLLLERVAAIGHDVTLVQETARGELQRGIYKRATNLEVHIGGDVGRGPLVRATTQIGRRAAIVADSSFRRLSAPVVENAAARLLEQESFDVVVASSLSRVAWRRLRAETYARGTPCVLYLREDALLPHLALGADPDLVIANSPALAGASGQAGFPATFVPSVVNIGDSATATTSESILVVNPTPAYGGEVAISLASEMPDLRFVLQESSRLSPAEWKQLHKRTESLRNVEIRPHTDNPSHVYRDAKVLLIPYRKSFQSARPRVVLEAQHNGIPVLASDLEGLRSCVGAGGRFVEVAAPIDTWERELRAMLLPAVHDRLARLALAHAAREEMNPARVTDAFLAALVDVATGRGHW